MTRTSRRPNDTLVIGVLGGIASGKSAVARLLAGEDGLVLDADRFAREALDSPAVLSEVRRAFGADVLLPDGRADRKALARRIFESPADRARLEGWIHPRVRDRIRAELAEGRRHGIRRIVLDVPLLLESDPEHGLADLCDVLVFVEADPQERARRASEERGWPPAELARREAAQMPLSEKRARAHHVIRNQGSLDDLEVAVRALLAEIGAE